MKAVITALSYTPSRVTNAGLGKSSLYYSPWRSGLRTKNLRLFLPAKKKCLKLMGDRILNVVKLAEEI